LKIFPITTQKFAKSLIENESLRNQLVNLAEFLAANNLAKKHSHFLFI